MAREPNEIEGRITSLDGTKLACAGMTVETVGTPAYISDVEPYEQYGLTEPGWYVFARIKPKNTPNMQSFARIKGAPTVQQPRYTVEGAAAYLVGSGYVDVAVRFEVAAQSVPVTIHWGATTETIVFRATDLAVRNLDYRVTFYVYDLAPFATWEYALTSDATFVEGSHYYTLGEDGEYHLAEVTAGDAVPADTYYKHSGVTFEGMTRNVTYQLGTPIDCPVTFVLPEIEDETHGCWFEMRFFHEGQYSSTLVPPEGVKVATEHTQTEREGLNTVDLHYSSVAGVKVWRFLNTHSTVPA